jgi:hypothetical protein
VYQILDVGDEWNILKCTLHQGCHNGRFWMKMSVRTSADVVRTTARVRIYSRTQFYPRTRQCVCADAHMRPRGHGASAQTHPSIRADASASARTWGIRADMGARADAPPSPPLSLPPLPLSLPPPLPPSPLLSVRTLSYIRVDTKKN